MSASPTFIGIEPASGRRPFTLAALDADLNLLALGAASPDEALAYAAGQEAAVIGVNAPARPSRGLAGSGRWHDRRAAEYELHRLGITPPRTPRDAADAPSWMQRGFALFAALENLGFGAPPAAPSAEPARCTLETHPPGAFTSLLGVVPFPRNSLEGRIQRQLVLYLNQVNVPNPMGIFEEITRHRLLKGILPLEELHTPAELDALAAAFTARFAAENPASILRLGDTAEGQVFLPVRAMNPVAS
jgi:hypothetical protein